MTSEYATLLSLIRASAVITNAIHDPFGFGYEGRVAISRELSRRRVGITADVSQYASESKPAPDSIQYQYLLSHGYYSIEELEDHPGRPPKNAPIIKAAEGGSSQAADETWMREQNEIQAKKEEKIWRARQERRLRWRRPRWDNSEFEPSRCPYYLNGGRHFAGW